MLSGLFYWYCDIVAWPLILYPVNLQPRTFLLSSPLYPFCLRAQFFRVLIFWQEKQCPLGHLINLTQTGEN